MRGKKCHYPPWAQYVSSSSRGGDAAFCCEVGDFWHCLGLVSNHSTLLEIKKLRGGVYLDPVLASLNNIGGGYHTTEGKKKWSGSSNRMCVWPNFSPNLLGAEPVPRRNRRLFQRASWKAAVAKVKTAPLKMFFPLVLERLRRRNACEEFKWNQSSVFSEINY